jgi:hypothetical protein
MLNLPNKTFMFRTVTMLLTGLLFRAYFVGMFIIYLCTKLHIYGSNGSFIIVIKKGNQRKCFARRPSCYLTYSPERSYFFFLTIYYHMSFQVGKLSVALMALMAQVRASTMLLLLTRYYRNMTLGRPPMT